MRDTTTALTLVAGFPLALAAFLWLLCRWEAWLLSPPECDDTAREFPKAPDEAQARPATAGESTSPGEPARVSMGSGRVVS